MQTLALPADRAPLITTGPLTRWQVLAGALLIQLILGTLYGYSVFWQPLESLWYPPVLTTAEAAGLGVTTDAAASAVIVPDSDAARQLHAQRQSRLKYAFGICLLSFAVSMIFAGRMQDVCGPRLPAMIGGALLAIAFLLAGALTSGGLAGSEAGRLLWLWLTIGLIAGVGIGFAYVSPIAALVKWFPRHKGLVAGLAVAGFGLGAWVFSNKLPVGAVGFIERFSIERFFFVHALVCLVAVCGGAALLRNPPGGASAQAGDSRAPERESSWRQTLLNARFYIVWLMFFSGALAGLMVIGILKPFAGWQLLGAATASGAALSPAAQDALLLKGAAAVGWLAIFNALGRIFWGLVSDRFGRCNTLTVMFALQALTLLTLVTLRSELSLAFGAACVGFNFGGNFALFPSITADLFGARHLGANYGWVFTSYGLAGVSGVALGNAAMRATGSYFVAFAIAAGMCLISAGLALWLGHVLRSGMAAASGGRGGAS
ncbi:MAG TPA: OFA family MFS transporter [Phycisphaerae bacterium]|nr:OFA family MFS transporter [Phycisphaerae bacterium]